MASPLHDKRGFTLIELMVSIVLFAVVMALAGGAFTNVLRGYQQKNIERHVFEEARFIMEKIVKEIRNGSVDYGYYYLHEEGLTEDDEVNYFDYYSLDSDTLISGQQSISPLQNVLVVVSPDGKERSMFWHSGYDFYSGDFGQHLGDSLTNSSTAWQDPDRTQNQLQTVLFKKMIYWSPTNELDEVLAIPDEYELPFQPADETNLPMTSVPLLDPQENWAWYNHPDFEDDIPATLEVAREAAAWRPISSQDVNIVDLQFIITPTQDPYKFWDSLSNSSEEFLATQSQPKVTIVLTIEPDSDGRSLFTDKRLPQITLQRTVSARSYQQIYYNDWAQID